MVKEKAFHYLKKCFLGIEHGSGKNNGFTIALVNTLQRNVCHTRWFAYYN
jgi:hypothetical protein